MTRIYRVVIDSYPEGSDEPGWVPATWDPGWVTPDDRQEFSWPRRKQYFSHASAWDRMALFERYGAKAHIETSKPIEWET